MQTIAPYCYFGTCYENNLQDRPSQIRPYMEKEMLDDDAGLRKSKGTRDDNRITKKAKEY